MTIEDGYWHDISVDSILWSIGQDARSKCRVEEANNYTATTIRLPDGYVIEVPGKHLRTPEQNRALFVELKLRLGV